MRALFLIKSIRYVAQADIHHSRYTCMYICIYIFHMFVYTFVSYPISH